MDPIKKITNSSNDIQFDENISMQRSANNDPNGGGNSVFVNDETNKLIEKGTPAVTITGFTTDPEQPDYLQSIKKMKQDSIICKDGDKYIWKHNGEDTTIEAANIEDAYKLIMGQTKDSESSGYFELKGSDGNFKKLFFTDEAAYGEKLDKSSTDKANMFDKTDIKKDNSFTLSTKELKYTKTTEKNNEETGKTVINKRSYSATMKNTENTPVYDWASSVGAEIDMTKQINKGANSLTLNANGIYSSTDAAYYLDETKPQEGRFPDTIFANSGTYVLDASATDKLQFAEKNNTKFSALGSIGIHGNATNTAATENLFTDGDLRITNDIGIEAKQKKDNLEFTNQLSIGMPLDLSKISYGATEKNGMTAGISFKGASKLNYSPMENLNLTANVGAFYTHTPHFDHSGINAEIGANYKTNKGNNLFATIGVEQEREHLSMNLFDETLKNEAELSTSIGYERKKVSFEGSISYNTGTKQTSGSISAKFKR